VCVIEGGSGLTCCLHRTQTQSTRVRQSAARAEQVACRAVVASRIHLGPHPPAVNLTLAGTEYYTSGRPLAVGVVRADVYTDKTFPNLHSASKINKRKVKTGPVRDLNPGPLAPKARIIPLDQQALLVCAYSRAPERDCKTHLQCISSGRGKSRVRPGFEPGTSRTRSENHTPRPTDRMTYRIVTPITPHPVPPEKEREIFIRKMPPERIELSTPSWLEWATRLVL